MKKKLIITAITLVFVLAVAAGIYVFSGFQRIEVQTHRYLLDKGYSNSDISTIKVDFPFVSPNLSYNGWTSTVVFSDEPGVKYHFILVEGKIKSNGFSCKGVEPKKLEQFE